MSETNQLLSLICLSSPQASLDSVDEWPQIEEE